MRVLWVSYAPIGLISRVLFNNPSQSGGWIDAMYEPFISQPGVVLGIACIGPTGKRQEYSDRVILYSIGTVRKISGSLPPKKEVCEWGKIIDDFCPDIIMVWGTEYANGYSVQMAAKQIPVMYFIQGVVGKNNRYSIGKLGLDHWIRPVDLVSRMQCMVQRRNEKTAYKQIEIERMMVDQSAGIIIDNEWAKSYYQAVSGKVRTMFLPLPIKKVFLEDHHRIHNCIPHSIFTAAGRYPGKGLFQLIKAIRLVADKYPDVKLFIPGDMDNRKPDLIFQSPYMKYLNRLIRSLNLSDAVVFCGPLTSEQMKEHILSCNVYVMPSLFENHSSSLREAMYLGAPCVTTLVGSVDEFTQYGVDALTYRTGEIDSLAQCIIRLFENPEYAEQIGENAYRTIRKNFPQAALGEALKDIYTTVIGDQDECTEYDS